MKSPLLIVVICFALIGCGRSAVTENDLIKKIFSEEYQLTREYFNSDRHRAEKALSAYLSSTEKMQTRINTPQAHMMLFSGRALALARLEFLIASTNSKPVELDRAVSEFKKATPSNSLLTNNELAFALIELVRGDAKNVGWLENFDKLASDATIQGNDISSRTDP